MTDANLTIAEAEAEHGTGQEEGDLCRRDGCCGRMEIKPTENCCCHISPPCWGCTNAPLWCPECGWESGDE